MKILTLFALFSSIHGQTKEYSPINGWYNNRGNPALGVTDTPFTRRIESHYQDGVYEPSGWLRPNPRTISETIFAGNTGIPSTDNITALFYFFGQHILSDIVDGDDPGCPPEHFNILIEGHDPYFNPDNISQQQMPYQRSVYSQTNSGYAPNHPRDQLNGVTSFLDGSSIYGNEMGWVTTLRLRGNCPGRTNGSNWFGSLGDPGDCRGELASLGDVGEFPALNSEGLPLFNPAVPRDHVLKSATRFYKFGSRFANENPGLTSIAVMWFRYHNWWAREIRDANPGWNDDRVFNEARIRNVATFQKIVLYEWLPILLGTNETACPNVPAYSGYSPGTSVALTDIFQASARHYLSTLAPPAVYRRSKLINGTCTFRQTTSQTAGSNSDFRAQHVNRDSLRLCNTYWNSDEALSESGLAEILLGLSSQITEQADHIITDDLRNAFYGTLQFSRTDYAALAIQGGRDSGLPDYNTAREELGFEVLQNFIEINPALFAQYPALVNSLTATYSTMNNLDIFTGGMLETSSGQIGPLFCSVIRDQFLRIRNGDRFWFENNRNGLLTTAERSDIFATTLKDVILRTNPDLIADDLIDNPFVGVHQNPSCQQPAQISGDNLESCVGLQTYDYFSGSEISFPLVLTFVGLFIFFSIGLMHYLGGRHEKNVKVLKSRGASKRTASYKVSGLSLTVATELLGEKSTRQVQITMSSNISLKTNRGKTLRVIEVIEGQEVKLMSSNNSDCNVLLVRVPGDTYDLILRFGDTDERNEFMVNLRQFLALKSAKEESKSLPLRHIMNEANTKEMRDELLRSFFKAAISHSLNFEREGEEEQKWKGGEVRKLYEVQLSKREFADYLQLRENSLFVEQMFSVADADNDGSISFREFLDIIVLFTKGSGDDKTRLMFNMYDVDKSGSLSPDEFRHMLKSMMEMVNAKVDTSTVDDVVKQMMTSHGFEEKTSLTVDDFQFMMGKYSQDLGKASLQTAVSNTAPAKKGRSNTRLRRAQQATKRLHAAPKKQTDISRRVTRVASSIQVQKSYYTHNKFMRAWVHFVKLNQYYGKHIFWVTLYTAITVATMLRSYNEVLSNKPSGLERIVGISGAVARGSAAALMFNFSTLLLTMCRNTITLLRETFLHHYIPFDSAISMHKFIAWLALCFTTIHVVAHSINFYAISTQSPLDLLCLFRDIWYRSDFLPDFVFWGLQTLTGVTGFLLTLVIIFMYVFASDYSRRTIFNWFQWSHFIGYLMLYFFCVLHGSGALISSPRFYLYFLVPGIWFTLDRIYTISRHKREISVVKAELLPSSVTHLEFKRPSNFDYKAGQWVRIACLAQSSTEYHPFTLSSSPHEDTLKLHIRAVGPWTINLRKIYDPEVLRDSPYPKLYLDGPFGEGHQDWYKYEVSVLVGGGIGVTPFASILKDLVYTTQTGKNVPCKAVYFMWVTRDQKQYEWLTDIIKEVEDKDTKEILHTHIFITQFPQKFDLRTTMLYICEQQFQKVAGKSLFTGLRAITHFGRPDFTHFFASLADHHDNVKQFGVFSCGPPPMTNGVDSSCSELNKYEGAIFSHHFENF